MVCFSYALIDHHNLMFIMISIASRRGLSCSTRLRSPPASNPTSSLAAIASPPVIRASPVMWSLISLTMPGHCSQRNDCSLRGTTCQASGSRTSALSQCPSWATCARPVRRPQAPGSTYAAKLQQGSSHWSRTGSNWSRRSGHCPENH